MNEELKCKVHKLDCPMIKELNQLKDYNSNLVNQLIEDLFLNGCNRYSACEIRLNKINESY